MIGSYDAPGATASTIGPWAVLKPGLPPVAVVAATKVAMPAASTAIAYVLRMQILLLSPWLQDWRCDPMPQGREDEAGEAFCRSPKQV